MKEIQREGRTLEKTIDEFLKEYNLQKEDVSFTIIEKGSRGLLNLLGKKPAVVKFMVPEEEDVLKSFLEGLLKRMDISCKEMDISYKDNYYYIHVKGVDKPGFLIGKEGRMLNSIQHLMNRVLENGNDERSRVILNIDNYRDLHEENLLKKLSLIVKKVKKRNKSITLEAMNASDRRIIYNQLEKDAQVRTMSIGKGEMKRIVVYPSESEIPAKPAAKKRPGK
jgi:spoIIIJ-associated protein